MNNKPISKSLHICCWSEHVGRKTGMTRSKKGTIGNFQHPELVLLEAMLKRDGVTSNVGSHPQVVRGAPSEINGFRLALLLTYGIAAY